MELVSALDLLKIKTVSRVWVDSVWGLEFTEAEPLDVAVEDELISNGPDAFRTVYKLLLPFATDGEGNAENVWTVLGDSGISTHALVAVLSHFVVRRNFKTADLTYRLVALQAASLYLLLLGIPGSIANKVFHPVLFDACLDLAKKCWPQDSGKKRKKDAFKSSQGVSKGRKRSKPHRKDDEEEMEADVFGESNEDEEMLFSGRDLLEIRNGIVLLVKTLLKLLTRFSLKDKPQCVLKCAKIFTQLTHFEPVIGELTFEKEPVIDDMGMLPELAYHGLKLLCLPKQGDGTEAVKLVFHRLLYVLLMMSEGDSSRPSLLVPGAAVFTARDQAIKFVCHIVDELKEVVVLPTLCILLQHICVQMVDKVEYRSSGAQTVVKLLAKMPCAKYASFMQWLHAFSLHSKVVRRMFALDVAMALIEQPERQPESSLSPEEAIFLQHKFLVQVMVFGRRSDRAPSVRGHALSCLARCLELQSPNTVENIQELFSATSAQTVLETEGCEVTSNVHETNLQKMGINFKTIEMTGKGEVTTFESKETMALLKRRSSDEKTNVRKSALQALMGLLKHSVIPCTQENLAILSDRCRDPAVSVKKKALQCLMDLLAALPGSSLVQMAWLRGVVPAIVDSESSVQEKALECLDQAIIGQIKSGGTYSNQHVSQKLAWDLLGLLCGESQDLGRYFSKAFVIWSKQNKFPSAFVNHLISHTGLEHASAAWLLLSKVSGSCSRLNYGKILDAWDEMIRTSNVPVSTSCDILCVIGNIAAHLNDETKSRIVDDIMKWLKSFEVPLEIIGASIETLFQLLKVETVKDTQRMLNKHCGELVSICESYLSSVILNEDGLQNFNEDLVVRAFNSLTPYPYVKHLYTLGVAALQCPAQVGKRTSLLVQSILASNVELPSADNPDEPPATQPLSQFKASSLPTVVRAHAFITLGKLCLQNEDLAKSCIPALARELEVSTEVPVRCNVVVVMCDLCMRYTTMVDRYIPNISACLKDREPLIREQTLILLTNLLQEEFVKWKGSLFFRFVAVLVDPEPKIASLCEFCLVHLLLKRNPTMFSQHFIECIFHFNSYEKHEKYNKFPQTARERAQFSLQGAKNKEKRMKIYRFLLEHFTDEQRFNITAKISQTILANFVDGILPLDAEGAEILSDAFDVLSLKEIKLSAMRSPVERDEQQDDEQLAMANAVMQVAQKKLISQVQKKNFIENVIPIIIALKTMLEKKRFPVLKDLMGYLQVMMQDYRSEVKDFFAADEQLAAELEYDMKRFEKEQEMEQQMSSRRVTDSRPASTLPSNVTAGAALATVPASPSPSVGRTVLAVQATPQMPGSAPPCFLSPKNVGSSSRRQTLSTSEVLSKARTAARASRLLQGRAGSASNQNTPVDGSAMISRRLQSSTTGDSSVANRAISTPQRSMTEVTFGDGLSVIFSAHGTEPKYPGNKDNMLFLMSPDKPHAPPKQWNVESPLCRKARGHRL
ncbi:condensin-2 complex subunit D3 isoform X1 [Brienomyrus brachyistius]|uniref:condensin-2 complex subunit D3 isoform X1 n=1 Tax=Brienomyrus brachyistius TaxID=42636 RepID=UPI0020B3F2DD|nr:condensin-2 complex subunit D3 isoform X1 [Brienomyrus brachyistius]